MALTRQVCPVSPLLAGGRLPAARAVGPGELLGLRRLLWCIGTFVVGASPSAVWLSSTA